MASVWNIRKFSNKKSGTSRVIGRVIANTDREAERKALNKFNVKANGG